MNRAEFLTTKAEIGEVRIKSLQEARLIYKQTQDKEAYKTATQEAHQAYILALGKAQKEYNPEANVLMEPARKAQEEYHNQVNEMRMRARALSELGLIRRIVSRLWG